jgi:DNA mismatch repair protein MutL
MSPVRLLDAKTANQIAAGEVVERPASVVKELVENSLDAGAATLRIEVSGGGLEGIRVLDDGTGMGREDLLLSLERHATSKISAIEDLATLGTLGFRGEALPSIASVSHMTLESAHDASGAGFRVSVQAGKRGKAEPIAHPRGTSVTVRNLFFNTPVRRKFLRSASTESGNIVDITSRIALAHFDRRFALSIDGKTLLDLPPAEQRAERVRQIFGQQVWDQLLPFSRQRALHQVAGFASTPEFTRSSSRDIRVYVNGRPVRDRGILAAVLQAYATLLPRGRQPFVLLFLDWPPGQVDFNVHPSKGEVRFAESGTLFDLVRNTLLEALQRMRPVTALRDGSLSGDPEDVRGPLLPSSSAGAGSSGSPGEIWQFTGHAGPPAEEPVLPGMSRMVPLAQYRESYILASDESGLVIVDQHAAHERILYEQLLRSMRDGSVKRQALLFPLSVELEPARSARVREGLEGLERLGFRVEAFGDNTWLIREAPAMLQDADLAALLRDLADEAGSPGAGGEAERLRDRLAATTACHAAVKVKFPLTSEKMSYLLDELGRTDSPMTCPHGRPVVLRMSHRDLEKNFHRR